MPNNKARVKYVNSEGALVPGVTTVISVLNKPFLVKWANNLGLRGIDSSKYVDSLAAVGSLAHYLILCHFTDIKPDTGDYTANQIKQAENCLKSFWQWEKHHTFETILVEQMLVSDRSNFGGTPDWYGKLDGVLTVLDFKTGKALYQDNLIQIGAYRELLADNGYKVDNCRIIRIGREDGEGFEERTKTNLQLEIEIFYNCLNIYNIQKELRR